MNSPWFCPDSSTPWHSVLHSDNADQHMPSGPSRHAREGSPAEWLVPIVCALLQVPSTPRLEAVCSLRWAALPTNEALQEYPAGDWITSLTQRLADRVLKAVSSVESAADSDEEVGPRQLALALRSKIRRALDIPIHLVSAASQTDCSAFSSVSVQAVAGVAWQHKLAAPLSMLRPLTPLSLIVAEAMQIMGEGDELINRREGELHLY